MTTWWDQVLVEPNIELSCAAASAPRCMESKTPCADPDGSRGVNCNDLLCLPGYKSSTRLKLTKGSGYPFVGVTLPL